MRVFLERAKFQAQEDSTKTLFLLKLSLHGDPVGSLCVNESQIDLLFNKGSDKVKKMCKDYFITDSYFGLNYISLEWEVGVAYG